MEKIKHVFIDEAIHRRVKNEAKKEGMKLKPFLERLLANALDYKKFLQTNKPV
jgi:predicted HicB family RNase H-like nuclease